MENNTNSTDAPTAVVDDKKKRSPILSKLMLDEYEDLRLGIIDDFYLCGLADKEHAIIDTPTNPWVKFFGKMHDSTHGLFSEYSCPVGPKRCFNCKQKVVQGLLPALRA